MIKVTSEEDISVIIPVLNEKKIIDTAVDHIRSLPGGDDVEIVVVDGSPSSNTILSIKREDVIKIGSPKGRGIQMNVGSLVSSGGILVFLHADTYLPESGLRDIKKTLSDKGVSGGAFTLDMYDFETILKKLLFVQNLRARITRVPYGDQVIFVRREDFFRIRGYSPIRLFEDVDLMKRMKREKMRIRILPEKVRSSGRRFNQEGPFRTLTRNHLIIALYNLGVNPDKLAELY